MAGSSSVSVGATFRWSPRVARSSTSRGLPSNLFARGQQGIYEARPDRAFATNRRPLHHVRRPAGRREHGGPAARAGDYPGGAREALGRRQAARRGAGAAQRGRDHRPRHSGARRHAAHRTTIPSGVGINSVDWPQPQQLDSNMGKVLRINTDGSIPKDNPFVGREGAHPEIYALGFRDIPGITIHPRTGKLWTSEHGPRGGDEINAVEKGKNYGFPVIGYGREYNGKPINGDKTVQEGMEQPVYFWTPDIAPAGIAFYTGGCFPTGTGTCSSPSSSGGRWRAS